MMPKGLRWMLWTLSSLAVLWTLLSLAMLPGVGRMMGMGGMRCCGMLGRGGMMPGSMMDGMAGGMMTAGMLQMALVVVVMVGLDAVFAYLVVTARRARSLES